jgi:hypothetical protein
MRIRRHVLDIAAHERCRDRVTKGNIMSVTEPMLNQSNFVLERRVNRPSRAVVKRLRDQSTIAPTDGFVLGTEGTLFVDGALRPSANRVVPTQESWRTTARLLTARG